MSGENLTPRAEQNSDNTESLDNNAEQPSFDSRVEPSNIQGNGVEGSVDSLPSGETFSSNQLVDFDSRIDPAGDVFTQSNDIGNDFDDRVINTDVDGIDTSDSEPYFVIGSRDDLPESFQEVDSSDLQSHDFVRDPLHEEDMAVGDVSAKGITEYMHTRNETLENDRHPITGVRFVRKVVERPDGSKVEGVFPEFKSEFTAQLPEGLYAETDKKQFCECNKQLLEAIEIDPKLRGKFSYEQKEQIKDGVEDGTAPDGYVWHHNEETGKMELVDADIHAKTGHTGGRAIWGGGTENR